MCLESMARLSGTLGTMRRWPFTQRRYHKRQTDSASEVSHLAAEGVGGACFGGAGGHGRGGETEKAVQEIENLSRAP